MDIGFSDYQFRRKFVEIKQGTKVYVFYLWLNDLHIIVSSFKGLTLLFLFVQRIFFYCRRNNITKKFDRFHYLVMGHSTNTHLC